MADYPLVRAHGKCPVCGGSKSRGLILCWQCYNDTDSGARAEATLDAAERLLSGPNLTEALARALEPKTGRQNG